MDGTWAAAQSELRPMSYDELRELLNEPALRPPTPACVSPRVYEFLTGLEPIRFVTMPLEYTFDQYGAPTVEFKIRCYLPSWLKRPTSSTSSADST